MTDGLQELYEASYRRLVAQLSAITGSRAEAEDVVQEAFARALQRWSTVQACDSPEAWIRVVALNLQRSKWRRATRGAAVMLRLKALHVDAPPPSPDHVTLIDAMKKLPEAQREALVLFHVADLSVDEIAAQLGIPSGTVKARLSRGRAALAADLGGEPADGVSAVPRTAPGGAA